jgi:hypothetical protein
MNDRNCQLFLSGRSSRTEMLSGVFHWIMSDTEISHEWRARRNEGDITATRRIRCTRSIADRSLFMQSIERIPVKALSCLYAKCILAAEQPHQRKHHIVKLVLDVFRTSLHVM